MNSGSKDGSSDNIFFHQLMKNHSPRGPPYKRLKNRRGIIINRTCHVTPNVCYILVRIEIKSLKSFNLKTPTNDPDPQKNNSNGPL